MEPAASAAGPHDTNGPATAAPKTDAVHAVGKGGRTDPNAADCARLVDRINEQLSDQIRVIGPHPFFGLSSHEAFIAKLIYSYNTLYIHIIVQYCRCTACSQQL